MSVTHGSLRSGDGSEWREAIAGLCRLRAAQVAIESIHFHLGQGGHASGAYTRAARMAVEICRELNLRIRFMDCGGGLPAAADDSTLPAGLADLRSAACLVRKALPSVEEIWIENGRFITGAACALVVTVLDIKDRDECRYVICDGGRTHQALAADAGRPPLLVVPERTATRRPTTVCGPTCMTDDRLGRWELPESIAIGDVLVWLSAGAYHVPWETRFSHGLCPIVWFDPSEQMLVARAREEPAYLPYA